MFECIMAEAYSGRNEFEIVDITIQDQEKVLLNSFIFLNLWHIYSKTVRYPTAYSLF